MLQSIRQNPWENIGLFEPPTKFETFTANEVNNSVASILETFIKSVNINLFHYYKLPAKFSRHTS